jgi:anti-sigma factor RsiW
MSDSNPDPRSLRLNAALDGELDAANALAFERDLAADPALAAEYRELEAVRTAVRRHAPRESSPKALIDSVLALADAGKPAEPTNVVPLAPKARPSRVANWLPIAASFAVLGFAAGVGLTALQSAGPSQAIADGLVSDYARAAIAGQPFDVASSDRHTVKPWLAGRTTVSADIIDLAPQGFPLAGGRVSVVDRVPAPTLVYRHNEHMVAVTELPLDARGARGADGIANVDGYHVARWTDANLAYVAVSDMDEKTLAEFVAVFRAARAAPQSEGGRE